MPCWSPPTLSALGTTLSIGSFCSRAAHHHCAPRHGPRLDPMPGEGAGPCSILVAPPCLRRRTQRQSRCYIAGSNSPLCRALSAPPLAVGCDCSGIKISGARQRAGRGHRKCAKSYCARYREAALQAGYRWKKIAMTFGRTTAATAALVFALISVTGCALAQGAPSEKKPMVRGKPIVQAKPSTPMGCKLVGTVKGTKIWAGNCVDASELRGTTPAEESPIAATTRRRSPRKGIIEAKQAFLD
jgi:hypothetical protein